MRRQYVHRKRINIGQSCNFLCGEKSKANKWNAGVNRYGDVEKSQDFGMLVLNRASLPAISISSFFR
jgi:hypothetical protein